MAGAAAGIVTPALAQRHPPLLKSDMLRRGDRVSVVDPGTAIYSSRRHHPA